MPCRSYVSVNVELANGGMFEPRCLDAAFGCETLEDCTAHWCFEADCNMREDDVCDALREAFAAMCASDVESSDIVADAYIRYTDADADEDGACIRINVRGGRVSAEKSRVAMVPCDVSDRARDILPGPAAPAAAPFGTLSHVLRSLDADRGTDCIIRWGDNRILWNGGGGESDWRAMLRTFGDLPVRTLDADGSHGPVIGL